MTRVTSDQLSDQQTRVSGDQQTRVTSDQQTRVTSDQQTRVTSDQQTRGHVDCNNGSVVKPVWTRASIASTCPS